MPKAEMRRIGRGRDTILTLVFLGFMTLALVFWRGGTFLVVDKPAKSDAILVTQGEPLDLAYWKGLELLKGGYGRALLVDARTNEIFFGRSQADWAADFVKQTAGSFGAQVRVCAIGADTTAQEVYEAADCLSAGGARSVALVVDDFHTRRSLAIFSRLLPGYRWSIAAVPDATRFGDPWWRKREWIRTTVVEWQHLAWWEAIDRWRFRPRAGNVPSVHGFSNIGQ